MPDQPAIQPQNLPNLTTEVQPTQVPTHEAITSLGLDEEKKEEEQALNPVNPVVAERISEVGPQGGQPLVEPPLGATQGEATLKPSVIIGADSLTESAAKIEGDMSEANKPALQNT